MPFDGSKSGRLSCLAVSVASMFMVTFRFQPLRKIYRKNGSWNRREAERRRVCKTYNYRTTVGECRTVLNSPLTRWLSAVLCALCG